MFEKVVYSRLLEFLETFKILYRHKFVSKWSILLYRINSNGWNSKALKMTNLLLGYCSISRCQDHPATQDSERAIISMQESSLYQEDPVTQKNKHDIDSK